MILSDLHTHTAFCDGANSPEEMVLQAIAQGMERIGFSGHSYLPFDEENSMSPEVTAEYIVEINRLKEKYGDRIEILCGTERDCFSDINNSDYDFVIGSVHFVDCEGKKLVVDDGAERQKKAVEEYFNGDFYQFTEAYYYTLERVVELTDCDIIGHFDLVSKYNDREHFFDENNGEYIKQWKHAVDVLINTGKLFEINTGAVFSGRRSVPYPAPPIIEYILSRGGRFILSSDSHSTESLCYKFDEFEKYVIR